MVSVDEASEIVFSQLFTPRSRTIELAHAVGKVLAEEIAADRDFPPFDRVAMDGIAIRSGQIALGRRSFTIEQIQAAGEPQKKLQYPEHAIEVMTGAILPQGTDAVIRYEDLAIQSGVATLLINDVPTGNNVHKQALDARRGEILLPIHTRLSPAEIALLAAVGKAQVEVFELPSVAIISSGDELVAVDDIPEPHQIRRSNVFAIEAAMTEMNWKGTRFHMPDREDVLRDTLREIVRTYDILILSGGVSKGKFDFIPQVLESVGIKKKFHQVSQRPGKPFWFGVSDSGKVAFALPGNPVSTYMCFYRYIKPWALKSLGLPMGFEFVFLAKDFSFPAKLTYFLQVHVKNDNGKMMAYPMAGGGSGDFANLKNVTGFVELALEGTDFKTGDLVPYIPFRSPV
jgi:molybdopterin molybdotransferase